MKSFAPDWLPGMMSKLGMEENMPLESKMVTRAIEQAQQRVEGYNFDIRKHVVEYDDVMNEQRKSIYALRRTVLGNDPASTKEAILDMTDELVVGIVERACPEKGHVDDWDFDSLREILKEQFALDLDFGEYTFEHREDVENKVFSAAEQHLRWCVLRRPEHPQTRKYLEEAVKGKVAKHRQKSNGAVIRQ